MSFLCNVAGHKWNGCTCQRCGTHRDEGHDWCNTCKCSICGKTRDEAHVWDGCKCRICGKIRDENHRWKNGKCVICGKKQDKLSLLKGKSERELIETVETWSMDFDLKIAAVSLIEDQAALERIATLSLNTKRNVDLMRKLDQIHLTAIEKLDSGEAVRRAFSKYDVRNGEYYDPKHPVFVCYLKRMQEFFLPNEEVDCKSIASLLYCIAHHVPDSRAWPAEVEELKQCYRRYGVLFYPVWDQVKRHASEYIIYPNQKTYGEGDDAFTISGDGVNIGVDLDAWGKENMDFIAVDG